MWLLWFAIALLILRFFEVSVFATLSWGWVILPFVLSFIWFEFIEPRLGLQKKKAMDDMELAKQARIKRAMESDHAKRRPR
jgi:small Trp-rich protein